MASLFNGNSYTPPALTPKRVNFAHLAGSSAPALGIGATLMDPAQVVKKLGKRKPRPYVPGVTPDGASVMANPNGGGAMTSDAFTRDAHTGGITVMNNQPVHRTPEVDAAPYVDPNAVDTAKGIAGTNPAAGGGWGGAGGVTWNNVNGQYDQFKNQADEQAWQDFRASRGYASTPTAPAPAPAPAPVPAPAPAAAPAPVTTVVPQGGAGATQQPAAPAAAPVAPQVHRPTMVRPTPAAPRPMVNPMRSSVAGAAPTKPMAHSY